jgi:hypothetical protein
MLKRRKIGIDDEREILKGVEGMGLGVGVESKVCVGLRWMGLRIGRCGVVVMVIQVQWRGYVDVSTTLSALGFRVRKNRRTTVDSSTLCGFRNFPLISFSDLGFLSPNPILTATEAM